MSAGRRHLWIDETCPRCGTSRQRRSNHSLYFDLDGRLVGIRAPQCLAIRVGGTFVALEAEEQT
jgi:hypothetical protein